MKTLLMLLIVVYGPHEKPYTLYTADHNCPKDLFITFNLERTQVVEFSLVDMLGRKITNHQWTGVLDQTYKVELPEAAGGKVFIVRLFIDNQYYSNKIYLSR